MLCWGLVVHHPPGSQANQRHAVTTAEEHGGRGAACCGVCGSCTRCVHPRLLLSGKLRQAPVVSDGGGGGHCGVGCCWCGARVEHTACTDREPLFFWTGLLWCCWPRRSLARRMLKKGTCCSHHCSRGLCICRLENLANLKPLCAASSSCVGAAFPLCPPSNWLGGKKGARTTTKHHVLPEGRRC